MSDLYPTSGPVTDPGPLSPGSGAEIGSESGTGSQAGIGSQAATGSGAASADAPGAQTYETASARVEEIIRRLDSGDASLNETLELVGEGKALIELCAGELEAVSGALEELRLDELVARLERRSHANPAGPDGPGDPSPPSDGRTGSSTEATS